MGYMISSSVGLWVLRKTSSDDALCGIAVLGVKRYRIRSVEKF